MMQGVLTRKVRIGDFSRLLSLRAALVCASGIILAQTGPAQASPGMELVQSETTDPQAAGGYTEEEFQGGPLPTNDPIPAETLSPEETARRIEQYRREAGTLGSGRWFSAAKLDFSLGIAVAYDDNIRVANNSGKEADEITSLSGRIIGLLGDYVERQNSFVYLNYGLQENLFATHSDEDALDQNGSLDVRYRWDRFAVDLVSRFSVNHDATADITQRETYHLYGESLRGQYHYDDKITFTSEASVNLNEAQFGASNQQYSLNDSFDYQLQERTSLGIGVVVGHLDADGGLHENFESPLLRLDYRLTDKVSLVAQAGMDIRERGSSAGVDTTPVFLLDGQWTPYGGTTFLLGGYRRVDASESLQGEDFTTTTVDLSIEQRFLRNFSLVAGLNYAHNDYINVAGVSRPARSDNYYFARVGVSYKAPQYFDCGLFYRRQQNDSSLEAYAYASNRVYLQFNFIY